jgi:hypothetical protein
MASSSVTEKCVLRLSATPLRRNGRPVFRPPQIPSVVLESRVTDISARGFQTVDDSRIEYRVSVREVPRYFAVAVEVRPALTLHAFERAIGEDYTQTASLLGRLQYIHLPEFLRLLTIGLAPGFNYLIPLWYPSTSQRPGALFCSVYQPAGPWVPDATSALELRAAASAAFRRHGSKLRDHTESLLRFLPRLESMTVCVDYMPKKSAIVP